MQLFYRSPRGLLLTSEGETFLLPRSTRTERIAHIPDYIAALRGSIQGHVTVGRPAARPNIALPAAIARVAAQYPGVRIVTERAPMKRSSPACVQATSISSSARCARTMRQAAS